MKSSNGMLDDTSCDTSIIPLCKTLANTWSQNIKRVQPAVVSCPSGWYNYSNHCYIISNSAMSQYEAQAYCKLQNKEAFLVELTSMAEYIWVY